VVPGGSSIVLVVGSVLALGGSLAVGAALAFWVVGARVLESLTVVIGLLGAIGSADVALARIEQILQTPPLSDLGGQVGVYREWRDPGGSVRCL